MRRQDELVALYPASDGHTKKFLLTQIEGLSLAFDSEELLEFLQGELADPSITVRHQALTSFSHFLPGFIKKRYALSELAMGNWSMYGKDKDAVRRVILEGTPASDARDETRRLACLHAARKIPRALLSRLAGPSPGDQTSLKVALAQFPLPEVRAAVGAGLDGTAADFAGLLTYSSLAQPGADEARVIAQIRMRAASDPSVYLLLSDCAPDLAFSQIVDLAPQAGTLGRVNLAVALSGIHGIDHLEAVRVLSRGREGWVLIYCLRALEATGNPAHVTAIKAIYKGSSNDFVQRQAIRASGGLRSDAAIELCLEALRSDSEHLRAQALESLVRLRCPPQQLREAAAPLLEARSVRTRINAVLATTSMEDEDLPPALMDFLLGSDAIDRLEGAYALGYLQNRRSLKYLNTLATLDPHVHVRYQAIKSLSKYPARHALKYLMPLLGNQDVRVALTAARVVTRYEQEEATHVCESLALLLKRPDLPTFERALVYRALGACVGKSLYQHAVPTMVAGLSEKDPKVLAGAVEGFNLFWWHRDDEVTKKLRELSTGTDRRTRPRALMALFLGGELDALSQLAEMVTVVDTKDLSPIVQTCLEVGLMIPEVTSEERFPALARRLDELAKSRPADAETDSMALHSIRRRLRVKDPTSGGAGAVGRPEGEFDVRRRNLAAAGQQSGEISRDGSGPRVATAPTAAMASPPTSGRMTTEAATRQASGQGAARVDPAVVLPPPRTSPPVAAEKSSPGPRPTARAAHGALPLPPGPPVPLDDPDSRSSATGDGSSRTSKVVDVLEAHLRQASLRLPKGGDKGLQKLREKTYLIGQGLMEPALWERAREFVATYKALIGAGTVVVAVMIILVASTWQRLEEQQTAPLPPLSVAAIAGPVQVQLTGKKLAPLAPGSELAAKTEIEIGDQGQLELVTVSGARFKFAGKHQIVVDRLDAPARRIELTVTRGYCRFAATRLEEFVVNAPGSKLVADAAAFSLELDRGRPLLIVDEGSVSLSKLGGPPARVDTGESASLE